mmetsp:Transcript_17318/g.49144  ORF Transcript_17318/g.49144 Transcript_17318/m.49144 type:complete len:241 (-) Transcript_17318:612-1334(-)
MACLLNVFLVALAAVTATPASAYPPPAAGGGKMWMACRPPDQIDEPLLRDAKPTEIALDECQLTARGKPDPGLVAADETNGRPMHQYGSVGCGTGMMVGRVFTDRVFDRDGMVTRSSLSQVDIMPEQERGNTYERFRFIKMHTYKRKVAGRGLQGGAETPITGVIGEELKAIFPDTVITNRAHLVGTPEPEESIHVNQYALLYKTMIVAQQLQTRSDNQAKAIEALEAEIAALKAQRALR